MRKILKNYRHNENGNIAMMFGVSVFMLILVVGTVVEMSFMVDRNNERQHLADIAVLAAAQSGYQTQVELQAVADNIVAANTDGDEGYRTVLTITPQNYIRVVVERDYEMQFMGGFGRRNRNLSAAAEAPPQGLGKLNLTMVLDVTGSMEGAKLTALKSAATELVDSLDSSVGGSAPSNNVMMSVVPFARYVRIPVTNLGQPWLEVEPTSLHTWKDDENDCGDNDDDGEIDDPSCSPFYVDKSAIIAWSGCMGSRKSPWHTRDYVVPGQRLQGFAGGGSCHSELLPLTSDVDAVKTTISGLTAEDDTFIPSGLMWGWRTLTPDAPFTEANTADVNERQNALILMTDGNNTRSYGGENDTFNGIFHWNSDQPDADAMTAEICTSIKQDGITVYTIAFEVDDLATTNMLRACATDTGKFFDAGSAIALEKAFGTIGDELAEVRISR